jgi:hypothetical protein
LENTQHIKKGLEVDQQADAVELETADISQVQVLSKIDDHQPRDEPMSFMEGCQSLMYFMLRIDSFKSHAIHLIAILDSRRHGLIDPASRKVYSSRLNGKWLPIKSKKNKRTKINGCFSKCSGSTAPVSAYANDTLSFVLNLSISGTFPSMIRFLPGNSES